MAKRRKPPARLGRLYIELIEPDCLALSDSPKFGEGARALLDRRSVGQLLGVLDGIPGARCQCSCGFELAHNHPESDDLGDYVASFEAGAQVAFGAYEARVLRAALQEACLGMCRTRT